MDRPCQGLFAKRSFRSKALEYAPASPHWRRYYIQLWVNILGVLVWWPETPVTLILVACGSPHQLYRYRQHLFAVVMARPTNAARVCQVGCVFCVAWPTFRSRFGAVCGGKIGVAAVAGRRCSTT